MSVSDKAVERHVVRIICDRCRTSEETTYDAVHAWSQPTDSGFRWEKDWRTVADPFRSRDDATSAHDFCSDDCMTYFFDKYRESASFADPDRVEGTVA